MQHIIKFFYGLLAGLKPQKAFKEECQEKNKDQPMGCVWLQLTLAGKRVAWPNFKANYKIHFS